MVWDKSHILKELRKRHATGQPLSYNDLARSRQALVSAAAYHFGSYRKAIEKAGIDYATILRRPRWTRQRIIALIKKGKRDGEDLNWSAVVKRRDELGKSAFASLQPRLFGKWDRALHAAGLDADDVSRYRHWDKNAVLSELKSRARESEPMNSGAIQRDDPGLLAAAVRHFKNFDAALRLAKIDPQTVRRRRRWTTAMVLKAIKQRKREGGLLSDSAVRREYPALYGAATRLFKSFSLAREKVGIKFTRKSK